MKKKKFYVSKDEMMDELRRYKETGIISEKLGEMFMNIAKRYTSKVSFYRYTYREDMVSDAILRMVSQVDKFNVDHPSANPFAYFTQIAYHQVLLCLKKEKKQRDIKVAYRFNVWDEICSEEGLEKTKEHSSDTEINSDK